MKTLRICLLIALCAVGMGLGAQSRSYSTQAIVKDLIYFTDWTASELVPGFKMRQLKGFNSPLMKQLAMGLSDGSYQPHYLVNSFKPVPSGKVLE